MRPRTMFCLRPFVLPESGRFISAADIAVTGKQKVECNIAIFCFFVVIQKSAKERKCEKKDRGFYIFIVEKVRKRK